MSLNFSEELKLLLGSSQGLLYVTTHEENRCISEIESISGKLTYNFHVWDCITGLLRIGDEEQNEKAITLKDPLRALNYIIESNLPGVFVLKDFHPFIKENSYQIIRALRNFLNNSLNPNKTIIIISPIKRIPIELQKQLYVLDYSLPDSKDISNFLQESFEMVKDYIEIPDEKTQIQCIKSLQGLTMEEIRDIIAYSVMKEGVYSPEIFINYKKQIIKKDDILEYYETDETLDSVGGLDLLKNWLQVAGAGFNKEAKDFGVETPKGLLLLGIPGTGKSLTCKVAGKIWGLPVIKFDIGKVMDRLVGSSEARMRSSLNLISSISPAILWIDEIEKGLSGIGSSNVSDGGTTSRVMGTLLNFLEDRKADVFVIATANSLNVFNDNPEFLRAGRFDAIFFSDLPNSEERKEIFSIHLNKRKRDPKDFDLDKLSKMTNDYTGAEIEQIIKESLKLSWFKYQGKKDLETDDIIESISEVIPLSKTMKEQIIELRSWAQGRAKLSSSPEDGFTNGGATIKILE